MRPNLEVKIGRLTLKNPVMVASGTFGEEYKELVDINKLGAYVTKTITLAPRTGNPSPRICETASGMLNSIGLENKGFAGFVEEKLPFLKRLKIPVVISIAANDESEFKELAKKVSGIERTDAIEVNLSCPNVKHGDREGLMAQDPDATHAILSAIRKVTKAVLIAKLTPNVTDITRIALSAQDAGADAVLIANTFPGMAVDIITKRPKLGNITGGLSGPAIKPLALKMSWDAFNKIEIPIIGCGGIMDYKDAIEFILCGARAIQVGTANFVNPGAAGEIVDGIKRYMAQSKIDDITKLVGSIKT